MNRPSIADFEMTTNDLLEKTADQIEKDWSRAGLTSLIFPIEKTPVNVIQTLNLALNELVTDQPESLATLLYLIDLNEAKLIWESGALTVEKLTEEIVKREFYKVKLRSIL